MKELIVLTGCSGRIGERITRRFSNDFQIVGFDTIPPKVEGLDYVKVDLASDESVKQGFDYVQKNYGQKIASCIHLAAYYSFSGGSPKLYEEITVRGSERILNNLKRFEVEQFLFSSTELVHKPCQVGEVINEDWPLEPKWDYPQSKVDTEELIHLQHEGIPTLIMRVAGCYDDWCSSIPIAHQIERIYEHQLASRLYPGDITHGAPFLHFDDLVEAIWLGVMKRKELPKETVLLIGEEKTFSYDELQREVSDQLLGKEFTTYEVPKWFAKMGSWMQNHIPFIEEPFIKPWMVDLADDHYVIEITRAKNLLGWEPKRSLYQTIPIMIQNLKEDPITWYKSNNLHMPSWLRKRLKAYA